MVEAYDWLQWCVWAEPKADAAAVALAVNRCRTEGAELELSGGGAAAIGGAERVQGAYLRPVIGCISVG